MIDIAYAMGGTGGEGAAGFGGFIPIIILGIIGGFILKYLAKKKGRNEWLWFFIGFPGITFLFALIILACLPNKLLMEKTVKLEKKVEILEAQLKSNEKTWNCNCGQINDMDMKNCSECGLKRDYLLKKKTETS